MSLKTTQPLTSVAACGGEKAGEVATTATLRTPCVAERSTTFTPSVPCASAHFCVGGISESTLTGASSLPTTDDVTVLVMWT